MESTEDGASESGVGAPGAFAQELVRRVNGGDEQALGELVALVRAELGALASRARRQWSPQPSLRTTELISEAYLRLCGRELPQIQDAQHFFALAAQTMRWILISRHRKRRGVVSLDRDPVELAAPADESRALDLVALDGALERLGRFDPELARLVELKFFLQLEMAAIATVLGVPERTVYRRWAHAKAFLYRELGGEHGDAGPRRGG